jgi:hypothetical protein
VATTSSVGWQQLTELCQPGVPRSGCRPLPQRSRSIPALQRRPPGSASWRWCGGSSQEHTPDFLFVTRPGTWDIDVRPKSRVGDKDKNREAFVADGGRLGLRAGLCAGGAVAGAHPAGSGRDVTEAPPAVGPPGAAAEAAIVSL